MSSESQPLIAPKYTPYREIAENFFKEGWPFFLTRGIELGTTFWIFQLLSSQDNQNTNHQYVAAASLANATQTILRSVFATVFYAEIALLKTENENKNNEKVLSNAFIWAGILGAIGIVLAQCSNYILLAIEQPEAAVNIAHEYLKAYGWGLPTALMTVCCQQACIAFNTPKISLWVTAVAKVLEIACAYLFVYGLNNEVSGLGYAGLISSVVNFLGFLWAFKKSEILQDKISLEFIRDMPMFKNIFEKGKSIAGYAFIELGTIVMATYFMGYRGNDYLAAVQPYLQYSAFIANLTFALGATVNNLVKKIRNEKSQQHNTFRYGNTCVSLSTLLPLLMLAFYAIFRDKLNSPFIEGATDSTVNHYANLFLLIGLVTQLPDTLRNTTSGALRGVGEFSFPPVSNLWSSLLLNVSFSATATFASKLDLDPIYILIPRIAAISVSALAIYKKWYDLAKPLVEPVKSQSLVPHV